MLRILPAAALALVLATACAGGAGSGAGAGGTTTQSAVASLTVTRSGGLAGRTTTFVIPRGDHRLAAVAHAVTLPLPASADVRRAGCSDCVDTEITVTLTDGSTATWRYDDQPPDSISALAQWVDQAMTP